RSVRGEVPGWTIEGLPLEALTTRLQGHGLSKLCRHRQERRVTRIDLDDVRRPRCKHLALQVGRDHLVAGADDGGGRHFFPTRRSYALLERGVALRPQLTYRPLLGCGIAASIQERGSALGIRHRHPTVELLDPGQPLAATDVSHRLPALGYIGADVHELLNLRRTRGGHRDHHSAIRMGAQDHRPRDPGDRSPDSGGIRRKADGLSRPGTHAWKVDGPADEAALHQLRRESLPTPSAMPCAVHQHYRRRTLRHHEARRDLRRAASKAACRRSATVAPPFLRFVPRWLSRSSSMKSSHSPGPPSSRRRARMDISSVTGRCRRPQAPMWASRGTSLMAFSVRL